MSAGQVAKAPSIGLVNPARLFMLTAVFAVGVAVGLAVPFVMSLPTGHNQAPAARSQAMEITPPLVSEPYLTVQHGIVVPPAVVPPTSFAVTPPLVSEPYLTVQHGIVVPPAVVPPTSFAVTPPLVSEPYLTVQHGIVVPPAVVPPTSFAVTPPLVSEPYLTVQHGIVVPPAP